MDANNRQVAKVFSNLMRKHLVAAVVVVLVLVLALLGDKAIVESRGVVYQWT